MAWALAGCAGNDQECESIDANAASGDSTLPELDVGGGPDCSSLPPDSQETWIECRASCDALRGTDSCLLGACESACNAQRLEQETLFVRGQQRCPGFLVSAEYRSCMVGCEASLAVCVSQDEECSEAEVDTCLATRGACQLRCRDYAQALQDQLQDQLSVHRFGPPAPRVSLRLAVALTGTGRSRPKAPNVWGSTGRGAGAADVCGSGLELTRGSWMCAPEVDGPRSPRPSEPNVRSTEYWEPTRSSRESSIPAEPPGTAPKKWTVFEPQFGRVEVLS